eukprot:ANDGO_05514.mRNA.1 hypothetical protein
MYTIAATTTPRKRRHSETELQEQVVRVPSFLRPKRIRISRISSRFVPFPLYKPFTSAESQCRDNCQSQRPSGGEGGSDSGTSEWEVLQSETADFQNGIARCLSMHDRLQLYAVGHCLVDVLRTFRLLEIERVIALDQTLRLEFLHKRDASEDAVVLESQVMSGEDVDDPLIEDPVVDDGGDKDDEGDVEMRDAGGVEIEEPKAIPRALACTLLPKCRFERVISSGAFQRLRSAVDSTGGFSLVLARQSFLIDADGKNTVSNCSSSSSDGFCIPYVSKSVLRFEPPASAFATVENLFSWVFPCSAHRNLLSLRFSQFTQPASSRLKGVELMQKNPVMAAECVSLEQAVDVCFGRGWFVVLSLFLRDQVSAVCQLSIHALIPLHQWAASTYLQALRSIPQQESCASSRVHLEDYATAASEGDLPSPAASANGSISSSISPLQRCHCHATSIHIPGFPESVAGPCLRIEQRFYGEDAVINMFGAPCSCIDMAPELAM